MGGAKLDVAAFWWQTSVLKCFELVFEYGVIVVRVVVVRVLPKLRSKHEVVPAGQRSTAWAEVIEDVATDCSRNNEQWCLCDADAAGNRRVNAFLAPPHFLLQV